MDVYHGSYAKIDKIDLSKGQLLTTLIIDKKSDEETASSLFYNSDTFAQLSDEFSEFYKKTWQEIYEILKIELIKKKQ